MKERRSLAEGVDAARHIDRQKEKQFVYGGEGETPPPNGGPGAARPAESQVRVPLTTRLRGDLAQALKRASLERQLGRVEPHTVQDILEGVLEPWLRSNGYLE